MNQSLTGYTEATRFEDGADLAFQEQSDHVSKYSPDHSHIDEVSRLSSEAIAAAVAAGEPYIEAGLQTAEKYANYVGNGMEQLESYLRAATETGVAIEWMRNDAKNLRASKEKG